MPRTKIICTIGPAVESYEKILALLDTGMNVARLNFSHGTHEQHKKVIEHLKKARETRQVPLAIMLDTKGPEIRVGKIKGDQVSLQAKQKLTLVKENIEGDEKRIQVTPWNAFDKVAIGNLILFDDGYLISQVVKKGAEGIQVELQNAGVLKTHKGVNIPNIEIDLPALTHQDIADITFGCENDVDLIAASFIRSGEHVLEIKHLLQKLGKSDVKVIAKIENSQGVQNFDSIVQVADGIMVARGDLGVELPLREVPSLQKMMIRKCLQAAKPAITATQMLESMIKNPRPTRAEVSDVANAIYDSTSAVMLSGETAVGQYPIETVRMMKEIVEKAEEDFDYREFFYHLSRIDYNDVSSSVALASVRTAYSAKAKCIFVFTSSGSTARLISRFRPEMPIFALTGNHKIYHQLSCFWGIVPVYPFDAKNVQEAFECTSRFALQKKLVHYGDLVVVTAGSPFGVSGTTNMIIVDSIGDVLVRGHPSSGKKIYGNICLVHTPDEQKVIQAEDHIVVITRSDDSYLPTLKHAKGIILQNHPEDISSEKHAILVAKALDIPILVRADGAMNKLKDEQLVTFDPEKGVVYKGAVHEKESQKNSVFTDC